MIYLSKNWRCLQTSMLTFCILASIFSWATVADAEVLVYENERGIRMVRPDGTEVQQLRYSDRRGFFGGRGKWSPDGQYFAYACSEKDSDYPSVRIIQSDGKNDRLIGEGNFIDWCPQSDALLYCSHMSERLKSGAWQGRKYITLYLFNIQQSKSVKISTEVLARRDQPPLISPDGNYVIYPVYESDPKNPSRWELYSVKDGQKSIIAQSQTPRNTLDVFCWLSDSSGFLIRRGLRHMRSGGGGYGSEILLVKSMEAEHKESPILTTRWLDSFGLVSFSPQRKTMAYVAGKKGLRILDLETLSDTKVADGDFDYLRNFSAWSPDGKKLAFATDYVSITCANGSGLRTIATPEKCGNIDQIAWSPDGRFIAYRSMIVSVEYSERGWGEKELRAEVRLFSLSTGKDQVLVDDGSFGGWSKTGKYLSYQKRVGYQKPGPSVSQVYVADGSGSNSLLIGEGRLVGDSWSCQ